MFGKATHTSYLNPRPAHTDHTPLCKCQPRCCCNVSVLQQEQLLIVWYIFSSFSSVSSNDYNQVFFLILQWAKEQRIVQRVSPWGALCWMVSNTWESGLQVGLLISPLGFPGECHLLHQPSSSTLLSHSHGGFNIACCLLCLLSFPWVGEKKNLLLKSKELTTIPFYSAPYTSFFFFFSFWTKAVSEKESWVSSYFFTINYCWFSGLFLDFISFLGPMSGMGMNMGMDGQWHYM